MENTPCCDLSKKEVSHLIQTKHSIKELTELFQLLSHSLRLKILLLLLQEDEICTCEITYYFTESQPIVSKHLRKLRKANLVQKRILTLENRKGRWHAYSINPERRKFLETLLNVC